MKTFAMVTYLLLWLSISMIFASPGNRESSAANEAYKKAYGLVLEGRWQEANVALEQFLEENKRSKWTDDAEFWLCYIASRNESNKEKAYQCFAQFVQNFPKSSYRADAEAEMVSLARDLVKAGKPEYEDKVRVLRQSQEKETTLMVLSALRDIGDDQAWDALLNVYEGTQDERMRKAIISMLDDFKEVNAAEKLISIYKNESSVVLRKEAIRSLKSLRENSRALAFLKEIASDEAEEMTLRKAALRSLGAFEDPSLIPFFEKVALQGDGDLALTAVRELGDNKHFANWDILLRIYNETSNPKVKSRVLATMGDEYGTRSLDFLTRVARESKTNDLRRSAIRALADVEHESVFGRLMKIIDEAPDSDTRKYGIRSLGDLKGEQVATALIGYLNSHRDASTRKEAAYALGESAKKSAIPHLKKAALGDTNKHVRRAAIRAIKELGGPDASAALIEILQSQNEQP